MTLLELLQEAEEEEGMPNALRNAWWPRLVAWVKDALQRVRDAAADSDDYPTD